MQARTAALWILFVAGCKGDAEDPSLDPPEPPYVKEAYRSTDGITLLLSWRPAYPDEKEQKFEMEQFVDGKWKNAFYGRNPMFLYEVEAAQPHEVLRFRIAQANMKDPDGNTIRTPMSDELVIPMEAPASPTVPQLIKQSSKSLRVRWRANDTDEVIPIFGYKVQWSIGGTRQWTVGYIGPNKTADVPDLDPGTPVTLRVVMYNAVNDSKPGPNATFTTLASVPFPPEFPKLDNATVHTLQLSWSEPYDGGGPILRNELAMRLTRTEAITIDLQSNPEAYYVTWDGLADDNGTLSHTIDELYPGSQYAFKARAVNSIGEGPWGEETFYDTLADVPTPVFSKPRVTNVTQTSAIFEWENVMENGSPLTAFTLQKCPVLNESMCWPWTKAYRGQDQDFKVQGLLKGQVYRFRVNAANLVGKTTWSPITTIETLPGGPEPPGHMTLKFNNSRQLGLGWEWPRDNGRPVTNQTLEMMRVRSTAWPPNYRPFVFKGRTVDITNVWETRRKGNWLEKNYTASTLKPATTYRFRLTVANVINESDPGKETDFTTPPDVPDRINAPEMHHRTPTSITVTWNWPSDNGANITHFILEAANPLTDDIWYNQNLTTNLTIPQPNLTCVGWPVGQCNYTISGLDPGDRRKFRVTACNWLGCAKIGFNAEYEAKTLPPGDQDPPELGWGGAHDHMLNIMWTHPYNGGTPITKCELQFAADFECRWEEMVTVSKSWWEYKCDFWNVYSGKETSVDITMCNGKNLRANSFYKMRVRCYNKNGRNEWSDEVSDIKTTNVNPTEAITTTLATTTAAASAASAGSGPQSSPMASPTARTRMVEETENALQLVDADGRKAYNFRTEFEAEDFERS